MKYSLWGLADFDRYCLKACTAQFATFPTEQEQTRLQEIAAEFFSKPAGDGNRPKLFLRFEKAKATVSFEQFSSTRSVDRNSFAQLLEKLGFQKAEGTPPPPPAEESKPSPEAKIAPAEKKGRTRSRTSTATHAVA